jgi:hypothetical protein
VSEPLNLGRQIHADVYRALRSVEVNELEEVGPSDLLRVAALASALAGALDAVFSDRQKSLRASKARTLRSEGRSRAD